MQKHEYQGTAKVFMNGRSQAVRLPAECRFEQSEVFIRKVGDTVILSPRPDSWDEYFKSKERPSADFMTERKDLPLQEREGFK